MRCFPEFEKCGMTTKLCSVPGCDRLAHSGPICSAHRTRLKKGQPMDVPIGKLPRPKAPRKLVHPAMKNTSGARLKRPSYVARESPGIPPANAVRDDRPSSWHATEMTPPADALCSWCDKPVTGTAWRDAATSSWAHEKCGRVLLRRIASIGEW